MVHRWVSLRNDKQTVPCQNRRVCRIFRTGAAYFYGDYELDIYVGAKHDEDSLEAVIQRVMDRSNGWISCVRLEDARTCSYTHLRDAIAHCGHVPDVLLPKLFQRKDSLEVRRALLLRQDGNFMMCACETARLYYVLCFATS